MEEYLHGQDGYRYIEHNRAGREIVLYRGQECAPRDGHRVQLTIDPEPAKHCRERDRCSHA